MLTFAIDFDGTFSADPILFRDIIMLMLLQGHQVIFVTGRSDEGKWGDEVRNLITATFEGLEFIVVFAGTMWKREAAEKAGFKVNIWVDDNPEYIAPQETSKLEGKIRPSN